MKFTSRHKVTVDGKRSTSPMWALLPVVLCFLSFQHVFAEDEAPKLIRLKTVEVEEEATSDTLSVEVTHEDISITLFGLPPAPGPGALLEDFPLPGKGTDDPETVHKLLDLLNTETKPAAERGKGD
ncbi:MAG: hypothetical protein V2A56_08595 [bacterium]